MGVLKLGTTTAICAVTALAAGDLFAKPVEQRWVFQNVDWCSAGVGGIGSAGTGTIDLDSAASKACGSGSVRWAYLYWHGINNSGPDAVYDNATIAVNGTPVTGTSIGRSSTNCWGSGSSEAFEADVTSLVSTGGTYTLTDLASASGHSANGAALIVIYDDGDPSNDRDLAFFGGNDSDEFFAGPPVDPPGWAATLPAFNYGGGGIFMELFVADGQSAGDGPLTITTANGTQTILDDNTLYDGLSVPNEGTGRIGSVALWDVHNFDITSAFGGTPANTTIDITGQTSGGDCLGLITAIFDLEAGSAPPPPPGFEPPPPGGVPAPTRVVPTLSGLGLTLLALLMPGVAWLGFRRRK